MFWPVPLVQLRVDFVGPKVGRDVSSSLVEVNLIFSNCLIGDPDTGKGRDQLFWHNFPFCPAATHPVYNHPGVSVL